MRYPCGMMKNFKDICTELRCRYFGEEASAKDYKDSYIVNHAIEKFSSSPEELMDDSITILDRSDTKVTKTLTLRSDCGAKLSVLAGVLHITDAEACRRILYHALQDTGNTSSNNSLKSLKVSELKTKLLLLEKEINDCVVTLKTLLDEIECIEKETKYGSN